MKASSQASSSSSMKSSMFFYSECEEHQKPHFLEACFLCQKSLKCNRDIFMYRGNTPFCSMECRQEQIEFDEARDRNKNWNLSTSMKSSSSSSSSSSVRNSDSIKSSSTNKTVRTGTVEFLNQSLLILM